MRNFAENDPVAFLNQHTEGMILDEVHNAPNLLSYIQGVVDDDADRRFILSGSSQFAMLKKVTQSLAGRTARTGQDAWGVVRELHRNGSLEAAV